jgi:hypothetical protein
MADPNQQLAIVVIPAAVAALAEILKVIATLKAHSGLTDEEIQAIVDQKLTDNEKALLALMQL